MDDGKVLPPDDTPLETHLDRLAEKHTWAVFEETLVSGYLTAVVSAQPSPVLLQVFVFSSFFSRWRVILTIGKQ